MCMDAAFHGASNGVLVLVTDDKFIAVVVVTADNWSPVSTINLSLVSTTPAVPRAQKKKTKRAAGSPAVSTQLALCLRLAIDL